MSDKHSNLPDLDPATLILAGIYGALLLFLLVTVIVSVF